MRTKSNGNSTTVQEPQLPIMPSGVEQVVIKPPKLQIVELKLTGTSPYVQLRFTEKAKNMMMAKMRLGDVAKKNKKREPRDFDSEFPDSMYQSKEGWRGISAASFRTAAISACRLCGFAMTKAKLSIFIVADGFDKLDHTPLVRIYGTPEPYTVPVKNETGVADIRVRAIWPEWTAKLRVRFDAEQFSVEDIVNLMARVGLQVGVGEGRHDSKNSCGVGFGTFAVSA